MNKMKKLLCGVTVLGLMVSTAYADKIVPAVINLSNIMQNIIMNSGTIQIMSLAASRPIYTDGTKFLVTGPPTNSFYTMNISGTQSLNHTVQGVVGLSLGTGTVTFSGVAVFANTGSYVCNGNDISVVPGVVNIQNTSGTSITVTGTGSDSISFSCTGL